MSKYFLIFLFTVLFAVTDAYPQSGFDSFLQKDSVYRFNSALKTLDSLLTVYSAYSNKDTSFFSSYGNASVFTLNQLLFAAVNNNPDLTYMQTQIDASDFRAEEKTFLSDPMFEFELDDIMSDFKKIGMYKFSVSQMFPFPGKLELEKKSVLNSKAMMQSERLSMAADIMNMIKQNYYDLYLVNRKLEVNRDNRLIIKTFMTAAEGQYMVGKGMQQEVFKSQIEMSKLKNEEYILLQSRENLYSELTRLTKVNVDEFTVINFSDIDTDYLIDQDNFKINNLTAENLINYAFIHRADLKSLRDKVKMNETDLEMAKISRLPDFNVKLGYKYRPYEERNAFSVMFGINIPLAPWSSGKYDFSEKKSEVIIKSTTEEISAKKNEIRSEITSVVNNLNSVKETMNFYYGVQIPQTENTMKSAQYSYESNNGGFLDLLDAYRMYQDSRLMYFESMSMYLKMIADLEKAAGLNLK